MLQEMKIKELIKKYREALYKIQTIITQLKLLFTSYLLSGVYKVKQFGSRQLEDLILWTEERMAAYNFIKRRYMAMLVFCSSEPLLLDLTHISKTMLNAVLILMHCEPESSASPICLELSSSWAFLTIEDGALGRYLQKEKESTWQASGA